MRYRVTSRGDDLVWGRNHLLPQAGQAPLLPVPLGRICEILFEEPSRNLIKVQSPLPHLHYLLIISVKGSAGQPKIPTFPEEQDLKNFPANYQPELWEMALGGGENQALKAPPSLDGS